MKLTRRTFTPADWLSTKPYTRFLPYDAYYVTQCRAVFDILMSYKDWFEESEMDDDNLVELAGMLGSYLEDYTSEIGLWPAFVRHNQTTYGYSVPFYDLTDYDPDYLNVADIAFLIWKYLAKHYVTRTYAPDHPVTMEIAGLIFDSLEDAIDKAPATNFYETYLAVDNQTDFFQMKEKLTWFGLRSYLLGQEFGHQLADDIEERAANMPREYAGKIAYQLREPYAFSERSSFSALTATEWFAEVARCPPGLKPAIQDLQFAHPGNYHLVDTTGATYYTFRHAHTGREYRVRKDSVQNNKAIGKARNELYVMSLRRWQGDWHLSGVLFTKPFTETSLAGYRRSPLPAPWLYDDETLAKNRVSEEQARRAFYQCFGGPLAFFDTEKAYFAATERLMDVQHQLVASTPPDADYLRKRDQYKKQQHLPPEFRKAKDIAVFYHDGVGSLIEPDLRTNVISVMQATAPSDEQTKFMFELLAINLNPALARYVLNHYDTRHVRFPIPSSAVDGLHYMEFFWRFYSPEEFGPLFPAVTIVGD